MPPTALSLLSPPSMVMLRLRPVEPPTENVPTRALVGSNDGCRVAPGIRIASDANERPFTGRFSSRRWSITPPTSVLVVSTSAVAFACDCDCFSNASDLQVRIDGRALEHVDHHWFLNIFGEALSLDFQPIVAGYELRDFVDAI